MRIDNSQIAVSNISKTSKPAPQFKGKHNQDLKIEQPDHTDNERKQAAGSARKKQINEDEIVKKSNSILETHYTRFEFKVHEKTEQIIVRVIDKNTNEIIREIPPEKILDMIAKMWELAGFFLDEKR